MNWNGRRALAFVRRHGIVLQAGKGPVPSLAEAIAGEPIRGSWWGHQQGKLIYRLLNELHESDEVAACRLVLGKVTLVHRRLWPALYKLAPGGFAPLDRVGQEHTPSGAHRSWSEPWPKWLPREARQEAHALTEPEAREQMGARLLGFVEQQPRRLPRQRRDVRQ